MMRFFFTGIALTSVVLTTELLELSANALPHSSTSIYIVQPSDSLDFIEQAVFNQSLQSSGQFSSVAEFIDLLDDLEQAVPNENQKPQQSTNTAVPNDSPGNLEQVTPTEEDQNLGQSTNTAGDNDSLADLEQAVHNQVNQYRASRGLPPLSLDSSVSEQARNHSQNMASGAVAFSHDGFSQRVEAIATVLPYSGAAENVGYNQGYASPATQAVQGWLNSTEHRTHIEGNYNLTGIGVALNASGEYYFTQIFLSSP